MKPTGIPPHVNQMVAIQEMHDSLYSIIEKFETQTLTIVNAVKDAIHENDVQSGVVNLINLEVNLHWSICEISKSISLSHDRHV